MKVCRHPDKPCTDRYMKQSRGKRICRLDEWKRKEGECPYDKNIMSRTSKASTELAEKNKKLNEWL